jgi:protein-disulfide isomerase
MAEEIKQQEAPKKTIVVKKSLIWMVIIAAVLVIGFTVGWRLMSAGNNVVEYIASDSPVMGESNLYVIEFSDYECQYCQASEGSNQETMNTLKGMDPTWEAPIPKIIEEYVKTGKVSLVFRDFPVHFNTEPALASKCALEQGKFWEYHKMLFDNYDALTSIDLKKYAINLSLDISQFTTCLDSKKYQSSLDNDVNDGKALGVSKTPTFFIGNNKTGYEKVEGAQSFGYFKAIIDSKISV